MSQGLTCAVRPELQDIFKRQVQHVIHGLKDSDILQAAKSLPAVIKGFSLKKSNLKVFRNRIAELAMETNHTSGAHALVVNASLQGKVFRHLNLECLKENLEAFMTLFGPEPVILGLMLDARSDVASLAQAAVNLDIPTHAKAVAKARQVLRHNLGGLAQALAELPEIMPGSRHQTDISAGPLPRVDGSREAHAAGEAALQQHWENQAKALEDKFRLKMTKKQQELDSALKANQDLEGKYKKSQKVLAQKLVELKQQQKLLQAQQEQRQELVEQDLRSSLRAYLQPFLQAEQEQAEPETRDFNELMERSDALLEAQQEIDRRCCRRSLLLSNLTLLEAKLSEVERALSDSFNPLKELSALKTTLLKHKDILERKLKQEPIRHSNPLDLASAINNLVQLRELERMNAMLEELKDLSLISPEEYEQFSQQCFNRSRFILDRIYVQGGEAPADYFDDVGFIHRQLSLDQAGGLKSIIIIDGHNLMGVKYHSLSHEKQHREEFIRELKQAFGHNLNCKLELFFDSAEASNYKAGNLSINFSGGLGEHKADKKILERLQSAKTAKDRAPVMIVVTSDHDLAQQCKPLCTCTMSSHVFAALVFKIRDTVAV